MKIITHYDFDGMTAAGILMSRFELEEKDIFIMYKHGDVLPSGFTDMIEKDEEVYIVDFSITNEQMIWLLCVTPNVIWIDHHDTGRSYSISLDGIRYYSKSKPKCGALLTWEFLYDNKTAPEIVTLCNIYDVWLKDNERFQNAVYLNYAIINIFNNVTDYKRAIAAACKEDGDNGKALCNDLIITGETIFQTNKKRWKTIVNNNAFVGKVDGYKAICVNCNDKSSHVFWDKLKDYDLGVVYDILSDGRYNCSVYSTKIDTCNVICKARGGGGHPCAAGCIVSDLSELITRI